MSVDLKNSETLKNLMRAFAGESQARNRYTFAASVCRQQKLHVVEAVFRFTADQEKEHAEIFYNHMKELAGQTVAIDGTYPVDLTNDVKELLRKAQHNEYEEHDPVYKTFGDVAQQEGFSAVAASFHKIAEIERAHGNRFGRLADLLEQGKLKKGDVFVVGCSSSEIVGGHIGKDSSLEAAQAVYAGIAPVLAQRGIWLAAQCCEHLNRAIIMEREAAEQYGWEEVCVVPRPHAGGSWATTCWKQFKDPIAVEEIRAHAGIDIGGTLIGMHLRRVAVPVRLSLSRIGEANILCARTRPKLIGGERAKYTEED